MNFKKTLYPAITILLGIVLFIVFFSVQRQAQREQKALGESKA